QGKISLLSGASYGYYFKVGESISAALGRGPNPLQVEVIPTRQTRCNLYGLQTGCTDLALVQSDIAHDAWYGHPPISSSPLGHIALVGQLYVETVHILVRPHLNLGRLADLRGRRVWLGSKDSFTVYSARRILDAAGLTTGEINALESQSCPPSAMNNECKTV